MTPADKIVSSMARSQEAELRYSQTKLRLVQTMLDQMKIQNVMSEYKELHTKYQDALNTIKEYEKMLTLPVSDIPKHPLGKSFTRSYGESQKVLANWIVSQKAFKEVAISYGAQLDIPKEKVIYEANKKKIGVIGNTTNPNNNTSFPELSQSPLLKFYVTEDTKKTLRASREAAIELENPKSSSDDLTI